MTWKDDLPVAFRDHGLRVHEGAGWRDFGVGSWTFGIPKAALVHQFVWPPQNSDQGAVDMLTRGYDTGSYFLNPPVANAFLGKALDGDVYLIGGNPAQHAGRGVRAVFDNAAADRPPLGDGQNAPGPDDWDGGSFCYFGTEMHHYYQEPFAQYDALVRMCTALCQVFGWTANRILEHSNHTTRKATDLVALDGNKMRRDIAARLHPPEDPEMSAAELAALTKQITDLRNQLTPVLGYDAKTGFPAKNMLHYIDTNVNNAAKAQATEAALAVASDRANQGMNAARAADAKAASALTKLDDLHVDVADVHRDVADVHLDVADVHVDVAAVLAAVNKIGGPPTTHTYTVQAGDTWDRIARAGLAALNPGIVNPDVLNVGDVLVVPGPPK